MKKVTNSSSSSAPISIEDTDPIALIPAEIFVAIGVDPSSSASGIIYTLPISVPTNKVVEIVACGDTLRCVGVPDNPTGENGTLVGVIVPVPSIGGVTLSFTLLMELSSLV